MPIDKTLYDHDIDFGCDTTDDRQHEKELILDHKRSVVSPYSSGRTVRNVLLCMVGYSGSDASNAIRKIAELEQRSTTTKRAGARESVRRRGKNQS